MSQRRIFVDGEIYFITTRTFDKYPVFENIKFCQILLNNICYYRKKLKFKLLAYCILPDHLHLLIRPRRRFNISQIMQLIKYRTTSDIRKFEISHCSGEPGSPLHNGNEICGTIWQKSFYDRIIRNDRQLQNTINYINCNAVHHELVDDPVKWPYSSYHNHYQTGKEIMKIDYFEN